MVNVIKQEVRDVFETIPDNVIEENFKNACHVLFTK